MICRSIWAKFGFIDGLERAQAQQLGQLLGVNLIRLVARAKPMVVTRVTDHDLCDQRFEQRMQPGRVRAFFERDMHRPAQTFKEIPDDLGVGGDDVAHHDVPDRIVNRDHDSCFVDIHAHILLVIHRTLLICGDVLLVIRY